ASWCVPCAWVQAGVCLAHGSCCCCEAAPCAMHAAPPRAPRAAPALPLLPPRGVAVRGPASARDHLVAWKASRHPLVMGIARWLRAWTGLQSQNAV
ncbi:MAG: hypothetical protein J3K34DRAFT_440115, partial [Monoraphidium minutum]